MTRRAASEHNEQSTFVEYVFRMYQHSDGFIRPLLFSVPNGAWVGGSSRGGRIGMVNKLKAEGMRPGVADVLYLQPRGPHPFLAIEMKTEARRGTKNGGISDDQYEWLQAASMVNAYAYVCYGADEAMGCFDAYMKLEAG